jgi:hypothetical protein
MWGNRLRTMLLKGKCDGGFDSLALNRERELKFAPAR